tara:strand:+ start:1532 stop:1864 length:333 start_codon:yes stop_codon:yes gene_type:complete
MSAWVVGLALAAGYLINKNIQVRSRLETSKAEYNTVAKPATGSVTTGEIRTAWANTDFTRYGDMSEDLTQRQKDALDAKVVAQQEAVEQYDASEVPSIQGVLLTYDRLGF